MIDNLSIAFVLRLCLGLIGSLNLWFALPPLLGHASALSSVILLTLSVQFAVRFSFRRKLKALKNEIDEEVHDPLNQQSEDFNQF